jgi:hypothetical protein
MEDVAVAEEQQETVETTPEPKRKRGRPLKRRTEEELAEIKLAANAPSPRYLKYNSDSPNKSQKTSAAWAWANELSDSVKAITDLTVYRDWPVTLAPLDESDQKSIDCILGAAPDFPKHDQDLVDRYGAGEYRCYYNVNAKTGRRLLFTAYVKCTHDFRSFPPTDRRIDDANKVDLADKSNGTYVAWLRATGKLKDEDRETKEKEDMAATGNVMAELVKDMAQDRRELTQKLLEKTEQQIVDPPPEPPSPKEVLTDQLAMFKSLKELVPSSDPMEMMRQVVATAQLLVQKDGNADIKPLMDEIKTLREESRATEREMWRTQLTEIKEQLRAVKEAPQPGPNVLLPDGSNLNSIVEKAVAKAVESGLGESDHSWWVDPLKQLMPVAVPALLQALLRPAQTPTFPIPPPTFQAGAQMQMQPQPAQLPAPQPQQAQPQANGAYTTGNPQLDMLLMMIQVPLADHLRDDASGAEFAEFFIENFSFDIHTQLASSGADAITGILYGYPPLAPILKPLARERVVKFVKEFVDFKPPAPEAPAGGAA